MQALKEIGINPEDIEDIQDYTFANSQLMFRFEGYLNDPESVTLEEKMLFWEAMRELNELFNELWERQYGPILTARKQAIK